MFSIKPYFRRTLSSKYFVVVIVFLSLAIGYSSIHLGLQIDDFWHFLYFSDSPEAMQIKKSMGTEAFLDNVPMNMFGMFHVYPHQNLTMMETGTMPWWASPDMRLSFFRPLAALTHWPEYRYLREHLQWMHLHNLLWYAALTLTVAWFYRRMMGASWVAGLAALIYALHDSHAAHLLSISQRNALISVFLGVWSILFYIEGRQTKKTTTGYRAFLFYVLSLLAADTGLTVCAFLFSYALFMEDSSWKDRFKPVLPYVIITIVWRLINTWLGYGAFHNEMYIDPSREPLRFIPAVFERVPILLNSFYFFPPLELYWILSYKGALLFCIFCTLFLLLFICVLYPLLRQSRVARFWALSALLAVIPVCAVTPDSRNLIFAGIAGFALMTQFIGRWGESNIVWPKRWLWRIPAYFFGFVFVLVHIIASPIFHYFKLNMPNSASNDQFKMICDFGISEDVLQDMTVVIVNPPVQIYTYYPAVCFVYDIPIAQKLRTLATATSNLTLRRLDEKTLSIEVEDGYFPPPGLYGENREDISSMLQFYNIFRRIDRYYRSHAPQMEIGQKIVLPGMTAEILTRNSDHRPLDVAYHFDIPLEQSTLRWLQWSWKEQKYLDFHVPEIGQQTILEREPGLLPF